MQIKQEIEENCVECTELIKIYEYVGLEGTWYTDHHSCKPFYKAALDIFYNRRMPWEGTCQVAGKYTTLAFAYHDLFQPTRGEASLSDYSPESKVFGHWGELWGGPDPYDPLHDKDEVRKCRALALCFAQAMLDMGDL